jgi:DNA-binding transcriptional MerR regulator
MTRNELAKKMKVTPKTIFEWQKIDGFPKNKVFINGIKWRYNFDVVKVKQWLEERKGKEK